MLYEYQCCASWYLSAGILGSESKVRNLKADNLLKHPPRKFSKNVALLHWTIYINVLLVAVLRSQT